MDLTWLSAIIVGAGCLALGYYLGAYHPSRILITARASKGSSAAAGSKKNKPKDPLEVENLAEILEDFKMVLPLSLSPLCFAFVQKVEDFCFVRENI